MPSLSIHGAGQVLRPPEDGLPFLRHDRAGEQTLSPGGLSVHDGWIAALEPDPSAAVQVDAGGGAVVPGFVDCHTHLPFAWPGSGTATGEAAVLRHSRELAAEMLREGTTAFDCRGGSVAALRLAARLAGSVPQEVTVTAAVAPDELPRAVAETPARALAVAEADLDGRGAAARAHDLELRVDADRAAGNALELGARSVHGLTELGPADVAPLAAAETAAVLLPGHELLHAEHVAPGRRLADAGAVCALATGCHPGTTPTASLPLALGLAGRLYGWSALEGLLACTLNAAWALGLSGETGSLEPGKRADVLVLDGPVEAVPHRLGRNPVAVAVCGGDVAWVRPDQQWRITAA